MTLDAWIIEGRVGISSKTMWAAIKGLDIKPNHGDKPYDPSDFGRCYDLVKHCELSRKDLIRVAVKLPYWEPYIANWDKLCDLYEKNVERNWENYKEIGMYEYMQELRSLSDVIRKSKINYEEI